MIKLLPTIGFLVHISAIAGKTLVSFIMISPRSTPTSAFCSSPHFQQLATAANGAVHLPVHRQGTDTSWTLGSVWLLRRKELERWEPGFRKRADGFLSFWGSGEKGLKGARC